MPEENINQSEEPAEVKKPETDAQISAPKRRFFSRRNGLIALLLSVIVGILLVVAITLSYRYGVFDNYIKQQFVAKMADIGIVFDADVLRVTIAPLQLQLKNATFNDKVSGEKLFFM